MTHVIAKQSIINLAKGFRFQWEEAQQSFVLLYPEGMVKLNLSAGEILNQCDGINCVGDIIEHLEAKFPNANLEKDVYQFIEDAYVNNWIIIK